MSAGSSMVRAVVFDAGETLVDETRAWGLWADGLGIPRLTFFAGLGAVIARGGDFGDVFELFRPGLDRRAEAARLDVAGRSDLLSLDDLYPDALPCLRDLAAQGYRLAIAANQPAPAEAVLAAMAVPLEFVIAAATVGVNKPDAAFFEAIVARLDLPPPAVAYVGDRPDNDVAPAARAGMRAIWIRRGPWAWAQVGRGDVEDAAATIDSLAELPGVLARLG